MTMFNNGHLPLNLMQELQRKAARGVKPIERNHASDLALIEAYQGGMEEAGMSLFISYLDIVSHIYRFPHKVQFKGTSKLSIAWTPMDKEDLFQEIALHFFDLIDEHDQEVGNFEGIVKGKLHLRVFDNFFEDAVSSKLNEVYEEEPELEAIDPDSQGLTLDDKPTKVPAHYLDLYNALNQLTARQRQIVELSVVKGWNATEIGKELGITPANTRMQLKKALDKLKNIMIPEEAAV